MPFISANVRDTQGNRIAEPLRLLERGGRRFAFTGVLSRRFAVDGIQVEEPREAILQATDRLPDSYRQVFLLKDVEGLSYEQIAEATGDSIPAIKSRLHRARLALREAIEAFYKAA